MNLIANKFHCHLIQADTPLHCCMPLNSHVIKSNNLIGQITWQLAVTSEVYKIAGAGTLGE